MWPGDLAPDHSDLGSALLLLCLVDIGNLLAEIEAASLLVHVTCPWGRTNVLRTSGVINALDLDQTRLRVGCPSATLVAQVAAPGYIAVSQAYTQSLRRPVFEVEQYVSRPFRRKCHSISPIECLIRGGMRRW